jgi:hypothetical protein
VIQLGALLDKGKFSKIIESFIGLSSPIEGRTFSSRDLNPCHRPNEKQPVNFTKFLLHVLEYRVAFFQFLPAPHLSCTLYYQIDPNAPLPAIITTAQYKMELEIAELPDFEFQMNRRLGYMTALPENSNRSFRSVEEIFVPGFAALERCLYDMYMFQNIRDIPILTRKINYLSIADFKEDAINRGLYNTRRLVSIRYLEEKRKMTRKRQKGLPLSPEELIWVEWASLAANEETKAIKTRNPLVAVVLPEGSASGGSDSGYLSDYSTKDRESDAESDWKSVPTKKITVQRAKAVISPLKIKRQSDESHCESRPTNETKKRRIDKQKPSTQVERSNKFSAQQQKTIDNYFPPDSCQRMLDLLRPDLLGAKICHESTTHTS